MPAYTISSSLSERGSRPSMIQLKRHLGIDLQQQIRQLRFADPVIERGAQLDQLRLLFLGRQRRQVQLVIDLEVTGLYVRDRRRQATPATLCRDRSPAWLATPGYPVHTGV